MSHFTLDKFGENLPVSGVVAFSQVALGIGVGLVVADRVGPTARRAIASALVTVGIAALMPIAMGVFFNIKHRPGSSHSMRRRLESIRRGFSDHDNNPDWRRILPS